MSKSLLSLCKKERHEWFARDLSELLSKTSDLLEKNHIFHKWVIVLLFIVIPRPKLSGTSTAETGRAKGLLNSHFTPQAFHDKPSQNWEGQGHSVKSFHTPRFLGKALETGRAQDLLDSQIPHAFREKPFRNWQGQGHFVKSVHTPRFLGQAPRELGAPKAFWVVTSSQVLGQAL